MIERLAVFLLFLMSINCALAFFCEDKANNVVISNKAIPKPHKVVQLREIKYAVLNFPKELSLQETEEAIGEAFSQWSNVIPIDFRNVARTGETPNIKIYFNYSICHAYAFSVISDRTVFNTKFQWAYKDTVKILGGKYVINVSFLAQSFSFIDLNKIALHEIGHHLGIPDDHGRKGSIMQSDFQPYYDKQGNYIRAALGSDDIETAQKLYGPRSGRIDPFRRSKRFYDY